MPRYPHQGTTKDGSGKVICSATVAVFLASTSTPASIYTASAGGVAVNSVTSGADTSSAPGYFIFWVDRSDYAADQEFDITISKSGFNSQTYSFIVIDNAADYPLLLGRAGGQVLYGGTASGDDLILHSTSNATKGSVGVADLNFYINSDYAAGDEDATLDFNNSMAQIKLDYASAVGVREFYFNESVYINDTIDANAEVPSDDMAYVFRVGATYTFPVWNLADATGLHAGYFQLVNNVNEADETKVEIAVGEFQGYALTANSKAAMYGVDIALIKGDNAATASQLLGVNAIVCSKVDPGTNFYDGSGVRASSQTLTGYAAAVRQHSAFLAMGDKGWKYPFLALDTDGATVLAQIDQYGRAYFLGDIDIIGDTGTGTVGRTKLVNAVNATVTNDYVVAGGQAATTHNTGWWKIYIDGDVCWIPYWKNATP